MSQIASLYKSSRIRRFGSRQWSFDWTTTALAALVVLATALRLYHLGAKGLWTDEVFTALFASAENDLAAVARRPLSTPVPTPPLWFLITHLFLKVLGSSDIVVRLPSVLFGVLGILAIYKVGEALFDRTIALTSAFLLAVSPMHLHYSREARFYAGIVLFSLLSLYFFYRGVNSDERKWWGGFTVVTLVNLYTHLTAFFVLAVEILYACLLLTHDLVAARRSGTTRRFSTTFALPLLISLGIIAACYAPMIPHILRGIQGTRGLGNPSDIEGLELSVGYFLSLFGVFGAGAGIPLSLYMAAFLWGLINAIRKQWRQGLLILLWTVGPFAMVFLLRPKHWFAPKYVIFILPLYLMTLSLGLTYLARSIARALGHWNGLGVRRSLLELSLAALLTIYTLMSISGLDETYAPQKGVRWREIGQFLTSNMQPDDAVISFPYNLTMPIQDLMAYYSPTAEEIDFFAYNPTLEEADVPVVGSQRQMQVILGDHRRVWIVIYRRSDNQLAIMHDDVIEWLSPQPYVELPLGGMSTVLYTGLGLTRLALLEEAKHFTHLTAEAYGSIGEAYCSKKMWKEALVAYTRAAEMEPGQGIWHYCLATLYAERGQRDKALVEYQQAIRLQSEIPGFHAALGDFYRQDGRTDEAISQYRQAIRLYTSQNAGAENSEYVRSWNDAMHELKTSVERAEATDNASGLNSPIN